MSDFIKVNFKSGVIILVKKDFIMLVEGQNKNSYYCTNVINELSVIQGLLTVGVMTQNEDEFRYKMERISDSIIGSEITREEYDRLCKELGVEN